MMYNWETHMKKMSKLLKPLYCHQIWRRSMQMLDELVITSTTLTPTSTALITPDTACIGDKTSSSTASYDSVCVTIKLHRVSLLEKMRLASSRIQHSSTPPEIHLHRWKRSWCRWLLKRCVCCILDSLLTTQLKGSTWGFHHCLLNGSKNSGNPLAEYYWRNFRTMDTLPVTLPLFSQWHLFLVRMKFQMIRCLKAFSCIQLSQRGIW